MRNKKKKTRRQGLGERGRSSSSDKKTKPSLNSVRGEAVAIFPNSAGDASTASHFLERLRPGGPWVLTAIVPDGPTTTITARDPNEVTDFIRRHDGQRNLYYAVNPLRKAMTKKAAKVDVAAIEYLLADLDPKDDESPADAKARYLKALEGFTPAPTAIIDSGNGIQVVWRLAEPIDIARYPPAKDKNGRSKLAPEAAAVVADAEGRSAELMSRLGCDDTSTKNIDRILRLPGTTNLPNAKKLKAGREPCPTRLIRFNDVAHALGAFPAPEPEKPKQKTKEESSPRDRRPLPQNLVNMLHVEGAGAYKSRSEALFAFINLSLRSGVDDDDIVAALLDETFSGKGIHEHCVENGGEDYVKRQIARALNDPDPATTQNQKKVIRVVKGARHVAVDQTEKALIAANRPVFYRGGNLVEPIWRREKTAEKNRDTDISTLIKLNPSRLAYIVAKHTASYQKYDGRTKRWDPIDPPNDVIEQLLARGHWDFPTVKGIINSPTMRNDGTLLSEPGYDRDTQLWYKPAGDVELPLVPERPTRDDALKGLKLIEDLLAGFPFLDEISRAVAVAGLMTPVLRGAFDFAPLYLFLAPEAGTGKTYLVAVISTIATGRAPMAIAGVPNKEEMEKRLSAAAFAAAPILSLNNLDFDLESALLNTLVTEGIIGIRPFGRNDQLVPCDCRGTTVFANGNNIRIVGDMVRRTLTCHLDAKMEVPEERTFSFDPIDRIKARRGDYLAAIFTITRAYMTTGCPAVKASPLAGFDHWSRMVRYPLIWLGYPDPVETMKEAREIDPVRESLRARIDALLKVFGTEEFTAADVFSKAQEIMSSGGGYGKPELRYPELMAAFTDGRFFNSKSIGNQLMKDLKRVANDYYIDRVKQSSKTGHVYKLIGEERERADPILDELPDGVGAPTEREYKKMSPEQARHIDEMLTESGTNRKRFLDHFKVKDIKDIAAADYERIVSVLVKRIPGAM